MEEEGLQQMQAEESKETFSFEKHVQPSIDALFSGKYDLIIRPSDEECTDPPCNLSLLVRILMIDTKKLLADKCGCKNTKCVGDIPNGVSL